MRVSQDRPASGLGMLSVEDCVEQIAESYGEPIDPRIPLDDVDVFGDPAPTRWRLPDRSRAQMQSSLRTKPANLDDLDGAGGARAASGRSRARRCTVHRRPRAASHRPDLTFRPPTTSSCASRSATRTASSSSATRCSRWRWRSPASRSGGGRAAAGNEPEAERGGDRKPSASASSKAPLGTASMRKPPTSSTTSWRRSRLRLPEVACGRISACSAQSAWLRHHYPAEFLCSP